MSASETFLPAVLKPTLRIRKKARTIPRFLKELRENGGFVNTACKAVKISPSTAYDWRRDDPDFADRWDKAVDLATEDLEKEARRRAYEGVEEPVFYKGEEVSRIRKYSDVLLMFTIKARRPEYRDAMKINVTSDDVEKAILQSHREFPAQIPLPPTFGSQDDDGPAS